MKINSLFRLALFIHICLTSPSCISNNTDPIEREFSERIRNTDDDIKGETISYYSERPLERSEPTERFEEFVKPLRVGLRPSQVQKLLGPFQVPASTVLENPENKDLPIKLISWNYNLGIEKKNHQTYASLKFKEFEGGWYLVFWECFIDRGEKK